jgi:hypothetical protein
LVDLEIIKGRIEMEKTYYGLRIKEHKIDSYGKNYKHNNGLLGAALEFLGEQPYYHSASSEYDSVWPTRKRSKSQ